MPSAIASSSALSSHQLTSAAPLLSPPPLVAKYATGEQAVAFAKGHASQHGYDLIVVQSRGQGKDRTWRLQCGGKRDGKELPGGQSEGEATDGVQRRCPFSVLVQPAAFSSTSSITAWMLHLKHAEHHCHLRQPAVTSAAYLNPAEKVSLANQLHVKPHRLIQQIKDERSRLGLVQLLHPKLVYNHLSEVRRRRRGASSLAMPELDTVPDLRTWYAASHDYSQAGNAVLFTHCGVAPRMKAAQAQELLAIQQLATLQKGGMLLLQVLTKAPASDSARTIAFALLPAKYADQSIWEWLLCQLNHPAVLVVEASAGSALRSAVATIWPGTHVITQASSSQAVRHYGAASSSFQSSPPRKMLRRPLCRLVSDLVAWQLKQWRAEDGITREQMQAVRDSGTSLVVERLWGVVAHPAIWLIDKEVRKTNSGLSSAREWTLARAVKMDCTQGLPVPMLPPLPPLNILEAEACGLWSTMGLPCAHRIALFIASGQELQPCDVASFWHLNDDLKEDEEGEGPGESS